MDLELAATAGIVAEITKDVCFLGSKDGEVLIQRDASSVNLGRRIQQMELFLYI